MVRMMCRCFKQTNGERGNGGGERMVLLQERLLSSCPRVPNLPAYPYPVTQSRSPKPVLSAPPRLPRSSRTWPITNSIPSLNAAPRMAGTALPLTPRGPLARPTRQVQARDGPARHGRLLSPLPGLDDCPWLLALQANLRTWPGAWGGPRLLQASPCSQPARPAAAQPSSARGTGLLLISALILKNCLSPSSLPPPTAPTRRCDAW